MVEIKSPWNMHLVQSGFEIPVPVLEDQCWTSLFCATGLQLANP